MNFRKIFLMIIWFFTDTFSKKEFKRFLNDNSGGLVLSFDGFNLPDKDFFEYKLLKADKSVKSIRPENLPGDFCPKACKLVDKFHKKTVNQDIEWMLYFDYTTGEVIYCWKGNKGKILAKFNRIHLIDKNIASIHSHPRNLYSFPSPDNFDILANGFEDFEIITSVNSFWIIEFKGCIDKTSREYFQQCISEDMFRIIRFVRKNDDIWDVNDITEELIGNYLFNEINNKIQGIDLILIKKEYD